MNRIKVGFEARVRRSDSGDNEEGGEERGRGGPTKQKQQHVAPQAPLFPPPALNYCLFLLVVLAYSSAAAS